MLNILFSINNCKAKIHFKAKQLNMCGYNETPSGKMLNF